MMQSNAVTTIIVVLGAVIPYLLVQQDVAVPPIVKVGLTAFNIGLLAYARLSGTTAIPVAELESPVSTPKGESATVVATTTEDDGHRP